MQSSVRKLVVNKPYDTINVQFVHFMLFFLPTYLKVFAGPSGCLLSIQKYFFLQYIYFYCIEAVLSLGTMLFDSH